MSKQISFLKECILIRMHSQHIIGKHVSNLKTHNMHSYHLQVVLFKCTKLQYDELVMKETFKTDFILIRMHFYKNAFLTYNM